MPIEIRAVDADAVAPLRELFRAAADCQIVHDSIVPRRLADPFLLTRAGEPVGYGAVWSRYHPGRVVEFHVVERHRDDRATLFGAFVEATGATEIEAQTNMPGMFGLLEAFGGEPAVEKILFRDASAPKLECPGATFRRRGPDDSGPDGEWVVEMEGATVAGGGILTHYNPPYGDLYMEVRPSHRRRGIGSFMVQELRRVCHESGLVPAARCDPDNAGSRRALERGGMSPCGRLLAARLGSMDR